MTTLAAEALSVQVVFNACWSIPDVRQHEQEKTISRYSGRTLLVRERDVGLDNLPQDFRNTLSYFRRGIARGP